MRGEHFGREYSGDEFPCCDSCGGEADRGNASRILHKYKKKNYEQDSRSLFDELAYGGEFRALHAETVPADTAVDSGTWQGIGKTVGDIPEESVRYVYPGSMTLVGGLCVKPFSIPHDAAEPVGYSVFTDNRKLTVATDIGCPTEEIKENIYDSDVLLLEANHDVDMLKKGSYPWALKKRILGERGHLSNVCAGQTLGEIMSGRLKYVFLGHLSSENNEPHLAFDTVRGILEETGVKVGKTVELDMASRYSNSRTIALGS